MSDDNALDLNQLSLAQMRSLVELLWRDRMAVSLMLQGHLNKLGEVANLPPEAAAEVVNLASCFNEISMDGAAGMRLIKEGSDLGSLN